MIELIQRIFIPIVFLVAAILILRECRLGIAEFTNLIRTAWGAEWTGRDKTGSFNRGASFLWFAVAFAVFLTQEIHAFLLSKETDLTLVGWMFFSGLVFLAISLMILAHMEKRKKELGPTPRRTAARK